MQRNLDDIRREGLEALEERLGQADMIRFLQQFENGHGDYARERHTWLERTSLEDIQRQASDDASRAVNDHRINIFYIDEDGCYVADVPDLKACSAFGATAEEALRELEIAKAAWLDAARAEGKPIPEPKYRPMIH
jgi:predicted RNase H-like HicB family nuclease